MHPGPPDALPRVPRPPTPPTPLLAPPSPARSAAPVLEAAPRPIGPRARALPPARRSLQPEAAAPARRTVRPRAAPAARRNFRSRAAPPRRPPPAPAAPPRRCSPAPRPARRPAPRRARRGRRFPSVPRPISIGLRRGAARAALGLLLRAPPRPHRQRLWPPPASASPHLRRALPAPVPEPPRRLARKAGSPSRAAVPARHSAAGVPVHELAQPYQPSCPVTRASKSSSSWVNSSSDSSPRSHAASASSSCRSISAGSLSSRSASSSSRSAIHIVPRTGASGRVSNPVSRPTAVTLLRHAETDERRRRERADHLEPESWRLFGGDRVERGVETVATVGSDEKRPLEDEEAVDVFDVVGLHVELDTPLEPAKLVKEVGAPGLEDVPANRFLGR